MTEEPATYILALAVIGASEEMIGERVRQAERLRGRTWLRDPVFKEASEAWSRMTRGRSVEPRRAWIR